MRIAQNFYILSYAVFGSPKGSKVFKGTDRTLRKAWNLINSHLKTDKTKSHFEGVISLIGSFS
jgi:hypothetical protein